MININWQEQLKIRIRESQESQAKHLIIKSLISFLIRLKYQSSLKHQLIYSEFPIAEGKICDNYHENVKLKTITCYEVQFCATHNWIEETKKAYSEFEDWKTKFGFNSVNWVVIPVEEAPNNINELVTWLKEKII